MNEEERTTRCAQLAREAVEFISKRIDAIHGVGFRGMSDLENEIYAWLEEHADFD